MSLDKDGADMTEEDLEFFMQEILTRQEVLEAILRNAGIGNVETEVEGRRVNNSNKRRRINRTESKTVDDMWDARWGRMLRDPLLRLESSYAHQKFQRRYLLPFRVFQKLLADVVEAGIFNKPRIGGRNSIPVEFKIMWCLRILGRDYTADCISELVDVGESTVNSTFKQFIRGFQQKLMPKYLPAVPREEDLNTSRHLFVALGVGGALTSTDVSHISWNKCPLHLKNICSNGSKQGVTLAFQASVSHTRYCLGISKAHYGTTPDSKIFEMDDFTSYFRNNPEQSMANKRFWTIDDNGIVTEWHGGFLITDGGYDSMALCMDPGSPTSYDYRHVLFREWLESVRKDVECFWGNVKGRFRILANPVRMHSLADIEALVHTCVCLHNLIHKHNGWDAADELRHGNEDINATRELVGIDLLTSSDDDESDEALSDVSVDETNVNRAGDVDAAIQQIMELYKNPTHVVHIHPQSRTQYPILRKALRDNFFYLYTRGLVVWPTLMRASSRQLAAKTRSAELVRPATTVIRARVPTEFRLVKLPSKLRSSDATGRPTVTIGYGLFTLDRIPPNTKIVNFAAGELVTTATYAQRCRKGRGDYGIWVKEDTILDCYEQYKKGACLASAANSPKNCYNIATNTHAEANAKLGQPLWRNGKVSISLYSKDRAIAPNTEILYLYANNARELFHPL